MECIKCGARQCCDYVGTMGAKTYYFCRFCGKAFYLNEGPTVETKYTEEQLNAMGDQLAKVLKLRWAPPGSDGRARYDTEWGSKTGVGLIRTLDTMLGKIKSGDAPHDISA